MLFWVILLILRGQKACCQSKHMSGTGDTDLHVLHNSLPVTNLNLESQKITSDLFYVIIRFLMIYITTILVVVELAILQLL